jgi:mannosyltransferase
MITAKGQSRLSAGTTTAAAVLLVLITALAVGLRLYRLDGQSLWYDEAFSAYLANMDLGEITARTAADIQPPLYYYLLHGWIQLFGDSEFSLRWLSALFGMLTVPLIYALAGQLFRSRLAGLLAALLLAVSPLHVWYAQEARMYTLLTFLGVLSSYLLLLAMRAPDRRRQAAWWAAYALIGIAAVYTHYFAFFVLAFQAIYLLIAWWAAGFTPRHVVLGGLAAGAAILLAYLPWVPHLLARYQADMSYWPGRLKLPEILVDVAVSFVGGESVLESTGILLSLGYVLVMILAIGSLLQQAAKAEDSRRLPPPYVALLFLLLYLLLPPALILALSYNSPKFNARYVMVSHPAFLLLLAGGLAALWQRGRDSLLNVGRGAVSLLVLLFLLGTAAYADRNIYADPAFARSDFRAVAQYLEDHVGPGETVLLVSGHAFPVFDYYAPDIERHLLPDSPTLDTEATLDFSIAPQLNEWLAGRRGVWLVLWQDEVVDPAGYLTTMLAEMAEEQPVEQSFAKVKVRHYRLLEDAVFSQQPEIAHPADFDFGNRLHLLGYSQTGERQVTLFWEALQPLDEDYRVSLVLRDTQGQEWGRWDGRPTAYFYPTHRWKVGQVVFGRYDLSLQPGSPPGDYGLYVGVYTEADPVGLDVLDPAGAAQGKRAVLGAVRMAVPAVTPDEIEVPHPGHIELGDGLALVGWELDAGEAQPGDRLHLDLLWAVETKPEGDYWARVLVVDAAGQTWQAGIFQPTNQWHPTDIWLPGQAWRGKITFRLPIQAQPGDAHLAVQLLAEDGTMLGEPGELGTLRVVPTDRVFTTPQPQMLRQANLDDRVMLLGADLWSSAVPPGGTLRLTLYWQALAEMDVPYTVFVHLLNADGQVVAGHDAQPRAGARPTTGWVPGEYISDPHELIVPTDLPPGEYILEAGMYDAGAPGMPRLPILEEGQPATDRIIFLVRVSQ